MNNNNQSMTNTYHLGPKLGEGRIAEIFAWGDTQAIKLFRPGRSMDEAEYEATLTRIAHQAGLAAPAVYEVCQVDGRAGIVMERVDGPSMLHVSIRRPWMLQHSARQLADLHVQMHRRSSADRQAAADLPSQRQSLQRNIERALRLDQATKDRLLQGLAQMPNGESICHEDFHPDNILLTASGPVIIDWVTARRGHPLADVARTVILLSLGEPPNTPPWIHALFLVIRRIYLDTYLGRYCTQQGASRAEIETWIPFRAAARLNEDIPGEQDALLKLIDKGMPR
ncbi:MAG: aminoglycoside phosphotransferase family protein [Anaerolineae bacterium]|nr:aminoglycoside phosphotransferase family protein [Anaerolineae bacterium]